MIIFLKKVLKYFFYFISGTILLATGFVIYLIWFQPPFYFPKPTGKYAIGVKDYHWIDINRKETFANDPEHPNRELMVKIWYPNSPKFSEKPTTPLAPDLINYIKKNQKLLWLFVCARPIYTYAKPNAQIVSSETKQSFPIIFFSHGRGPCDYDSNVAQCEELASHGYVVIGINHTYSSIFTKFPDGRIIDGMKAMKQRESGSNFTQIKDFLDKELEVWIADVEFVLDQLEQLDKKEKSFFYHRLDLKNIGIFGHSFGGATAVQICRNDNRVKAGVNLDGGLFGHNPTKKFNNPFMFMLNEHEVKPIDEPLPQEIKNDFKISNKNEEKMYRSLVFFSIVQLAKALGNDAYIFTIQKIGHLDFTYFTLLKHSSIFLTLFEKLSSSLLLGSIDGFRANEIINAYLVNFFDKYLKGQSSNLLDGKENPYSEIERR
ncbi:MAG: hypothetical protein ABIA74_04460 [bacterium]